MKSLYLLPILALLSSCQEKENGYEISGTIDVPDGNKIYISELNENNNQTTIIDTLVVTEGKFKADLPEKEIPTLSFITVEGTRGNVIYVADNTPIEFEIFTDSLYASIVTGGTDNEILYNYLEEFMATNKEMADLRQQMMEAFQLRDSLRLSELKEQQEAFFQKIDKSKVELIRQNPESIVSLIILEEMTNSRRFTSKELNEFFKVLSPELKETPAGKSLKQKLDNLSKVSIGSKAPSFSGPSPVGEEIALGDILGKVTLIDFWASWCKPCREENPNIVRVYEKYHDNGFNIIGVSLDRPGQKQAWINAIKDDGLSWNQISNLQFWNDPIALKYGVRAIPAAFLLDENGIIVAKNLRGDQLEEKVSELLRETP